MITEEYRGGGPLLRIRAVASTLKEEVKTVVFLPQKGRSYRASLEEEGVEVEALSRLFISQFFIQIFQFSERFIYFFPEML